LQVDFFKTVGGDSGTDFIYRNMKLLMDDELAVQITMTGRNGKHVFGSTKSKKAILGLC